MALALLFAIVLFDGALSGFRAAAGRSARIGKRRYYAGAMVRGSMAAAGLAVLVASLAACIGMQTATPLAYWLSVDLVVHRLLIVFGPIALLACALLALRSVGSVDVRSVASTLVFGPLTLLRTALVCAGGVWAALGTRADVAILTLFACIGMLSIPAVVGPRLKSPRPSSTTGEVGA
jgi:hypothetical protein